MEVGEQSASQVLLQITDASVAGEARRVAVRLAEEIGMEESDRGSVAIAVTEMATNIVKHAETGSIVCEQLGTNGARGIRFLAIDKGPGIRNISSALEDGYSTAGTSGNGLGAVRRLATIFDIYSAPERGTCIMADFWPRRKANVDENLRLGVISVAVRGESVCGDGWFFKTDHDTAWLMVADGLGHGVFAAEAAREAKRVLSQTSADSPAGIMGDVHNALRKTRGAAAAITAIDRRKGTLSFAGLGNISATLADRETSRGLASHNGTLGHQMHKIQEFTFPWTDHSTLIMHSDGLGSRWNLKDYPGLLNKHPSLIAAVLYRDFARERDDATVLVVKNSVH
ncbi:MAG TPA: ATP-binding SpoIIE family protein phosphatase [Terriglobales bacterium]|nr:ATP-binding SpoIIE family protein phosphatase [Terriglobales bacterium]